MAKRRSHRDIPNPPWRLKSRDEFEQTYRLFSRRNVLATLAGAPFAAMMVAAREFHSPEVAAAIENQVRVRRLPVPEQTGVTIDASHLRLDGFFRFSSVSGTGFGSDLSDCNWCRRGDNGRFIINCGGTGSTYTMREFELPTLTPSTNPASPTTISVYRTWGNFRDNYTRPGGSNPDLYEAGGMAYLDGRIWWTYRSQYTQGATPTMGYTELNDTTGAFTSFGPFAVGKGGSVSPLRGNSGFLVLPQWFANDYTNGNRLCQVSAPISGAGHSHGQSIIPLTIPSDPSSLVADTYPVVGAGAISATDLLFYPAAHAQLTDMEYKSCGFVTPYTCPNGSDSGVLTPGSGLGTDEQVWGSANSSNGTNDSCVAAVFVDLADRQGILFGGALVGKPTGSDGYWETFGDADDMPHRGYAGLPNGSVQGGGYCCHGQKDVQFDATGPWRAATNRFIWGLDYTRLLPMAQSVPGVNPWDLPAMDWRANMRDYWNTTYVASNLAAYENVLIANNQFSQLNTTTRVGFGFSSTFKMEIDEDNRKLYVMYSGMDFSVASSRRPLLLQFSIL